MAQGSSAGRNNWWFGGATNCYSKHMYNDDYSTDYDGESVVCFGHYIENGVPMMVRTLVCCSEVATTVNEYSFFLMSTENLSYSSWMSQLSNETCIKDIMMPASHDAGMSELRHTNFIASFNMGAVKTQKNCIYEQLMCGVRYFDIRVDYDHNELVTYHRKNEIGANGQSFQTVFLQAQDFLREHNSETIIFKIGHFRDCGSGHKPNNILEKFLSFVDNNSGFIYKSDTPVKLHEINLGNVRGKIILVVEIDADCVPDTSNGIFKYSVASGERVASIKNNLMNVYDEYSNTYDFNKMKKDQLEKWKNNGGQGTTKLFLLSWTLTLDQSEAIAGNTNEKLAAKANREISNNLAAGIQSCNYAKPNMVYLDYIDSKLCGEIILYNFK
jgi:1-phosphatidylinositol phosphodiesterase